MEVALQTSILSTPEVKILRLGFLLSLVWEIAQSPFYADTFAEPWAVLVYNRVHCSLGDVVILLGAFWLVALVWGRSWIENSKWSSTATFIALGMLYTAFSEYVNVYARQSWEYTQWMPTIMGIGFAPLLQWIVVPAILIRLVECSIEKENGRIHVKTGGT